MKSRFLRIPRIGLIFFLAAMMGLVIATVVFAAGTGTPSGFIADTSATGVALGNPIGIVATTDQLLFTEYCVAINGISIFSVADDMTITEFTDESLRVGDSLDCLEEYLDISPGIKGWKAGDVYVTHGDQIHRFESNGDYVGEFADLTNLGIGSLPLEQQTHTGITFDRVGTFGNDMIVTRRNGDVFRIKHNGNVTHLANLASVAPEIFPGFIENPEVVPVGFGPKGGQVWVAAEFADKVFAIDPDGNVTEVLAGLDGAEAINVIPNPVCNWGISNGAFFVIDFDNEGKQGHIVKFPEGNFTGIGGDVLVIAEPADGANSPIYQISVNAGQYVFSTFDDTERHHEGATFARCINGPGGGPSGDPDPDCDSPRTKINSFVLKLTGVPDSTPDYLIEAFESGNKESIFSEVVLFDGEFPITPDDGLFFKGGDVHFNVTDDDGKVLTSDLKVHVSCSDNPEANVTEYPFPNDEDDVVFLLVSFTVAQK